MKGGRWQWWWWRHAPTRAAHLAELGDAVVGEDDRVEVDQLLAERRADACDVVVVQQQTRQAREPREVLELFNLVIREVQCVVLVLQSAAVEEERGRVMHTAARGRGEDGMGAEAAATHQCNAEVLYGRHFQAPDVQLTVEARIDPAKAVLCFWGADRKSVV